MATNDFTTYRTNELLDAVTDAYDRALTHVEDPRWRKAIAAAFNQFLEADTVTFDVASHTLRIESLETPGLFYEANGRCQCEAAHYNNPCLHRALARLLARAFEAIAQADAEADAEDMADAAAAGPIVLGARARDAERRALAGELYDALLDANRDLDWTDATDAAVTQADALLDDVLASAAQWEAAALAAGSARTMALPA